MKLELPNITIFIQSVLFFGVFFVLNAYVFSPMLVIIEERRKRSVLSLEEAKKKSEAATALLNTYQEVVDGFKEEIRIMKETARYEAEEEIRQKIEATQKEFFDILQKTKQDLKIQATSAKKILLSDLDNFVQIIFQKFSNKQHTT